MARKKVFELELVRIGNLGAKKIGAFALGARLRLSCLLWGVPKVRQVRRSLSSARLAEYTAQTVRAERVLRESLCD